MSDETELPKLPSPRARLTEFAENTLTTRIEGDADPTGAYLDVYKLIELLLGKARITHTDLYRAWRYCVLNGHEGTLKNSPEKRAAYRECAHLLALAVWPQSGEAEGEVT